MENLKNLNLLETSVYDLPVGIEKMKNITQISIIDKLKLSERIRDIAKKDNSPIHLIDQFDYAIQTNHDLQEEEEDEEEDDEEDDEEEDEEEDEG